MKVSIKKGRKVEFKIKPTASNGLWLNRDIITMGKEYTVVEYWGGTNVYLKLDNDYTHPVSIEYLILKSKEPNLFNKISNNLFKLIRKILK